MPYKEAVKARKSALDRETYNNWVWSFILDRKKVDRKSCKFRFHHEITTDGVVASLLFSREVEISKITGMESNTNSVDNIPAHTNIYPGRPVGLDRGKRNIASMVDNQGLTVRYTTRQRNFESGLTRYRWS